MAESASIQTARQQQERLDQAGDRRGAFSLLDKNGDGVITVLELRDAMKALGENPTETDLEDMVSAVDDKGRGVIDYSQFEALQQWALDPGEEDAMGEIRDCFTAFDRDRDGFISADELRGVVRQLGQSITLEEAAELIAEGDADHDGRLGFDEFAAMMLHRTS